MSVKTKKTKPVEEPVELPVEVVEVHPFRYGGERCEPSFGELRNLVADTLDRLDWWSHLSDERAVRLNCEADGEIIVRAMMHDTRLDGTLETQANLTRFVVEEFDEIPYCKEHRL